jgi:hypothetical protein
MPPSRTARSNSSSSQSIDCWSLDPNNYYQPPASLINYNDTGFGYQQMPGTRTFIWQALTTRNLGEIVSVDQY